MTSDASGDATLLAPALTDRVLALTIIAPPGPHALAPERACTCDHCCHWSAPFQYAGRHTPHGVALLYDEWLTYHWHTRTHQRLDHPPLVA